MSSDRDASLVARALKTSRLFGALDAGTLQQLERSARTSSFLRGQPLWRDGHQAVAFTLITYGVLKIVKSAADGQDNIVGLFGPRESIGDAAVLDRGRYPAAAVVVSDRAEVVRIDAEPALDVLSRDPRAAAAVTAVLLDHGRALRDKIAVMSAGAVPRRLTTLFLRLAERFGDETVDGSLTVPFALRRGELASLIGATVETTIRTIRRWERAGIIRTEPDGFVISDPDAMRTLARGVG